jgi:hypothetical protein
MRVLFGILAGDVLFAVLTAAMFKLLGRDPHAPADTQFMAATAALGVLFAIAGGYLAATVARTAPVFAGLGVAVLIAGGAIASAIIARPASMWSQVAAVALLAPAAILGGFVRGRTHRVQTS